MKLCQLLLLGKNRVVDADEAFGQTVTAILRKIGDNRCKEFAKVKIQAIIFQAQFGMLPIPFQQPNAAVGPMMHLQSPPH